MSSRKIYNKGKQLARAPLGNQLRCGTGQPPRNRGATTTTTNQRVQKQSLLSKDGELKAQEIEEIINKKLGDISDDSLK